MSPIGHIYFVPVKNCADPLWLNTSPAGAGSWVWIISVFARTSSVFVWTEPILSEGNLLSIPNIDISNIILGAIYAGIVAVFGLHDRTIGYLVDNP